MESNDDSIGRYRYKSCVKDSCPVLEDLFSFILKMIAGKMVLSCEANDDIIHCKIRFPSNESNATLTYPNNSYSCLAHGLEARENDVNDLMSTTSLLNRNTDFVMFAKYDCEYLTKAILNDMFLVILDIVSGATVFTSTTRFNSREHNIFARANRPSLFLVHSDRGTDEKSNEQMAAVNVDIRSKQHHSRGKTHQCGYCGKAFPRPALVKIHERIHTGERPHKCTYCGKAFSTLAHVKSHEITHTGEKPYQCMYCEKKFSRVWDVKCHEKTHARKRNKKRKHFENIFSPVAASVENNVRLHTRKGPYEAYKCKFCGKSFASVPSARLHMRLHTGERPYKCKFCEKTFVYSSDVKIHERTHTVEKPTKCKYCEKLFGHYSHVEIHMRSHKAVPTLNSSAITST